MFKIQLYSCKGNLITQYKKYGGVEEQIRAALISELDAGEWSSSRLGFRGDDAAPEFTHYR
jgi:hypothetical protein